VTKNGHLKCVIHLIHRDELCVSSGIYSQVAVLCFIVNLQNDFIIILMVVHSGLA
jgi:hypothetical protein